MDHLKTAPRAVLLRSMRVSVAALRHADPAGRGLVLGTDIAAQAARRMRLGRMGLAQEQSRTTGERKRDGERKLEGEGGGKKTSHDDLFQV